MPSRELRIFSWNVNGLRAILRKHALEDFLAEYSPDILCLQEIKVKESQIDFDFSELGYTCYWTPAERPGYSGTGILVRDKTFESDNELAFSDSSRANFLSKPVFHNVSQEKSSERSEIKNFSPDEHIVKNTQARREAFARGEAENAETLPTLALSEGRITTLDLGFAYLVCVYTPNSKDDLSRLSLRETSWDPEFLAYLQKLEETKPVITCGDFNAAHEEIDLARPEANHMSAGFTDAERRGITHILDAGFVDTFRSLHPGERKYSWWSYRGGARQRNVGWRIDYFFISSELSPALKKAEIHDTVLGSDHCPISITLTLPE